MNVLGIMVGMIREGIDYFFYFFLQRARRLSFDEDINEAKNAASFHVNIIFMTLFSLTAVNVEFVLELLFGFYIENFTLIFLILGAPILIYNVHLLNSKYVQYLCTKFDVLDEVALKAKSKMLLLTLVSFFLFQVLWFIVMYNMEWNNWFGYSM